MKRLLRCLGVLAGSSLCFAGNDCSVYDKSLLKDTTPEAGPTTCEHATWPKPPTNGATGGDIEFVTALTKFDLGEPYQYTDDTGKKKVRPPPAQGYDLDGLCTQNPELDDPLLTDPSSCRSPSWLLTTRVGDLAGGRDNGLRYVIQLISSVFPGFGTVPWNQAIQDGKVSLLLQVKGYNGQPNDDHVDFTVYTSGSFTDRGNTGAPKFDGSDVWPIASDSYIDNDPTRPRLKSLDGYVRDSVLVGRLDDLNFRMRIGVSELRIVDLQVVFLSPFFTAKVVNDGLWRLKEGQIAARWRTKDLFATTKNFPNQRGVGPEWMCMNAPDYAVVHEFICSAADIYSGGDTPSPPCDALSVGIGFEGVQAQLGGMVVLDPPAGDCPEALDPKNDSCDHQYQGVDGGS